MKRYFHRSHSKSSTVRLLPMLGLTIAAVLPVDAQGISVAEATQRIQKHIQTIRQRQDLFDKVSEPVAATKHVRVEPSGRGAAEHLQYVVCAG